MTANTVVNKSGQPARAAARARLKVELKTVLIGVHCSPSMVAGLECFINSLPQRVSRPEAIRQIMADWLRAQGHLR